MVEIKRKGGRGFEDIREIKITKGVLKYALGSCLIEVGDTKVLCAVNVEDKVPLFLKGTDSGWLTAEYALLPSSTSERVSRSSNLTGRSQEIQRMIGRSLRAILDIKKIGERTVMVDCDVIQADGGTRAASITGGFIALVEALSKLKKARLIKLPLLRDYLGAISAGIVYGNKLLDLDYYEDSEASVDFNVVMTGKGDFVEIQGTAEGYPFTEKDLMELLRISSNGIKKIIEIEKGILKDDIDLLLGN
ncbi:MAG: ribonuclease PH [Candidatus Omnitrophica bacterium]|nr:ribonuclease PH [Candidatus Omnitrophota bacterium]MCM8777162.1 ribonuclease PH [Candidatus Omnitrophota bacterium]